MRSLKERIMHLELVTPRPLFDRKVDADDLLSQLMRIEREAWGAESGELNASGAKIRRRIESFSEGVTLATTELNREREHWTPVGSQFAFRFQWDCDVSRLRSWEEHTANGWTNRVHDPHGDTGFLVGVGVRPEFRQTEFFHSRQNRWGRPMRASMLLIAETLDKLFALGVKQVIANARVPHYHVRPELDVGAYCSLRRVDGLLFDPVLRFHERMGAKILKPVEYSMDDPESHNAGCWVLYQKRFEG
ncbi:MAG TPA: hypothetical protein VG102_03675 [Candidatus Paceibacterota bacterium]|nr:hypothetical protein [Candidatus Paceibacterota bacterium]